LFRSYRMKFTEKTFRKKRVYSGKAINVRADDIVLPDGKKAVREFMEHPGAVAAIPFLDNDTIILVKQYRYPVRELTYEIPAGKLDKGERPDACVRRELEEETGYRAGKIKRVASFWPTPAFSDEVIYIYEAHDLKPSRRSPDEDEFIDHCEMSMAEALRLIKTGKIRDSKTMIALLYWAHTATKKSKRRS
jgi:ADP-ribose pyrophosphatase